MFALAVLDLAGSIAAKEAVERRSPVMSATGALLYLLLFWVYASALQYAELAPVTIGWVVLLQIGVVLVDHYRYGAPFTIWRGVAIGVILVAQAFLLLGPTGAATPTAAPQQSNELSPAR